MENIVKCGQEKLEEYSTVFAAYNFSEFVFTWYVKEGKQSRLLATASAGRSNELGRYTLHLQG